ncbi:uncharacterized protein [Hyperolius riggenbachi]|uniref:uncharacterized protein n=1 Tax=Hyperolius riggenbachi TaxID=752182 RepID=UPI0035A35ED1
MEQRTKRQIKPPLRLTYDSRGNSSEEAITTVCRSTETQVHQTTEVTNLVRRSGGAISDLITYAFFLERAMRRVVDQAVEEREEEDLLKTSPAASSTLAASQRRGEEESSGEEESEKEGGFEEELHVECKVYIRCRNVPQISTSKDADGVAVDIFTNPQILQEFLELYRKNTCLWKVTSKDYSNRVKKAKAHNELKTFCQQFYPQATVAYVLKKIKNLRTVFKKELNKVRESEKSGAAAEDIYVPRLWYYKLLTFTTDQEEGRDSINSLTNAQSNCEDHCLESLSETGTEDSQSTEPNVDYDEISETQVTGDFETTHRHPLKKTRKTKHSLLTQECQEAMQKAASLLNTKDDECDAFGNIVATKLRLLTPELRCQAELDILSMLNKLHITMVTQHTQPPVHMHMTQNQFATHTHREQPQTNTRFVPQAATNINPHLTNTQYQHNYHHQNTYTQHTYNPGPTKPTSYNHLPTTDKHDLSSFQQQQEPLWNVDKHFQQL